MIRKILLALGLLALVAAGAVALDTNTSGRCEAAGCNIRPADLGDADFGDFSVSSGSATLDSGVVDATAIATGGVDTAEIAAGAVEFAGQSILTIGASPAATCTAGVIHIDTDESVDTNCTTTADNSLCLCVATDTWAALENN